MQSSTKPSTSNSFVPELWGEVILELVVGFPRMIEQRKLKALHAQAREVPGLEDIHDALSELLWRRLQQNKLEGKMKKLQRTMEEVRPAKAGKARNAWLRRQMERLKF